MPLNMAFCLWVLYHCHVTFLRYKYHAVLSGTKYGLKQTRGKFGLGAKMVCMTWGRLMKYITIFVTENVCLCVYVIIYFFFFLVVGILFKFYKDRSSKTVFVVFRVYFYIILSFRSLVIMRKYILRWKWYLDLYLILSGINLVKDEYRTTYWDILINEESKLHFILQAGYRYPSVLF